MHRRNWQRNLDRRYGQVAATWLAILALSLMVWVARKIVPPRPVPVVVQPGVSR